MGAKRSVSDLKEADLKGKKVFVRVDLNVPLDENLKITDDTRVRAAVPTIKYLMQNGAKVILSSHLGRPKGVTPKYSLKPLVPRLSELLGVEVKMADDCIGEEVQKLVSAIPDGGVLLLENVRFYREEEKNDPEFAKKLASLAELYVNDACGGFQGRPKGVTPTYSLKPLVPRLSELLGVKMADDCIGEEVQKLVSAIPDGGVLLLENVRFYREEEKNDPEFAKKLASLADLYVNDAFGSLTTGVPLSHVDSQPTFGEDNQKGLPRTFGMDPSVSESMRFDMMMENLRALVSESEEADIGNKNVGLPPLGSFLGDFDISTLQIIKNEDLEERKKLGSGAFGTVYHGKWRGTDVAIKRIKKSCFTGRSSEQVRLTVELWREVDILSKLHHPNVVAFYGVVLDGPGGRLATVAEYMVDGSLRHVLVCKDRLLDRRKRLMIARDAAFGMEYLHSKNIVHFDLKCDNLLVNLKDPSRPICKVADFGLSKIKQNTLVSGGVRGTLPWMAPELLSGSSSKVSEKVDVFSFGIVLWEILTGKVPYANMHYGAIIGGIINNTLRPIIPRHCDSKWKQLMEQCWAPDAAARPSFTEIASRLGVMYKAANQAKQSHKSSK